MIAYQQATLKRRSVDVPPPPDPPAPPDKPLMVISDTPTLIEDTVALVSQLEIPSGLYAPKVVWWNGYTFWAYQSRYDVNPPQGRAMMLAYHETRGFLGPFIVGEIPSESDSHTVPTVLVDANIPAIYVVQEDPHNVQMDIYKCTNFTSSDTFTFTEISSKIGQGSGAGTGPAYAHLMWKGIDAYCWSRGFGSDYSAYVTKSIGGFENWGGYRLRVSTADPANGIWHYEGMPKNNKVGNDFYLTITNRFTGGYHYRHHLLITQDFNTFRNFQNTYSHTVSTAGTLTITTLNTHFKYYEVASNKQSHVPRMCVSPQGDFYAFHADGVSGYKFIYYDGGWQARTVNIPELFPFYVPFTGIQQSGPCCDIVAYSATDIRLLVEYWDGSRRALHWIRTTNNLQTYTDLGDVDPTSGSHASFNYPFNDHEVPEDRNFMVASITYAGGAVELRGARLRVAAYGTIQ
jgi:hypothetical protein